MLKKLFDQLKGSGKQNDIQPNPHDDAMHVYDIGPNDEWVFNEEASKEQTEKVRFITGGSGDNTFFRDSLDF